MKIPHKLIDVYGEKIGLQALAVYLVLCRFADSAERDDLSHQTIADMLRLSRQQVHRALQTLAVYRLIAIIPQYDETTGEQRSHLYVLLDMNDEDSDDTEALPHKTNPHALW